MVRKQSSWLKAISFELVEHKTVLRRTLESYRYLLLMPVCNKIVGSEGGEGRSYSLTKSSVVLYYRQSKKALKYSKEITVCLASLWTGTERVLDGIFCF